MNILIITQYFWPEPFIINDISSKLVLAGHKVTILTGKPNYPEGRFIEGYKFWGIKMEMHNGIRIKRIPIIARGKGSAMRLSLNYLSFVLFGSVLFPFLIKKREYDVIFVYAPSPITTTIPAIVLKKIHGKKLCLWVQDLWPESMSATGHVKNKLILKLTSYLVGWIYRRCDKLLIQSKAFHKSVNQYVNASKIIYYPNTVDRSSLKEQVNKEGSNQDEYNFINGEFSVLFAGNIGVAQSVETIIGAAERLADNGVPVNFYLVGSGSRLEWAQHEVAKKELKNIYFPGRFPMNAMPAILSKADALLVTLKDEVIFSYTVPYKIQTYLAVGKPIIASLNGEGARIIEDEAKAGIACAAERPIELANAIQKVYGMSKYERSKLGGNGKKYFNENYEMNKLLNRLETILAH